MLQIISGKFYKSENIYSSECKGIFYSNYSWNGSIKTCVATLEPVEAYGVVSSYVINYVNQLEKDVNPSGMALVKVGDYEILKQLRLLFSFGLQASFDTEKSNINHFCRKEKLHSSDEISPSDFTRRFFNSDIKGSQDEIDRFTDFIKQVIGLPRDTYKTIIACISAFETSLRVLDRDINLAFSIMVYALETLSQTFDGFNPTWEDYEQNQRLKLERCFEEIDEDSVTEIKSILTNSSHLKLTKRFVEFTKKYIDNDFYYREAKQIESAIKKTKIERVLINAYNIRSGYVHNLRPLLKQITVKEFAKADVLTWDNEPYLTFAGLSRLTHHVIYNFIMQQPYLESEDYFWRNDLPGMIDIKLEPEYWIWNHEGIKQEHATSKMEGLLSQLVSEKRELNDIRELLKKYESIIPNAKEKYKIQMMVTYYLYNALINEDYKIDNYIDFVKKYEKVFEKCCIENMVLYLYLNQEWPWDPEDCEEVVTMYLSKRYKKNNIKIPEKIELGLFIAIANMYYKSGDIEKQKCWLELALFDCPGQDELQKELENTIDEEKYFEIGRIIWGDVSP